MTVSFLGAVFIRVSDLDKSIPFYSDVLGLKLREVEQWDDGRGANYIISDNSPLLTLIETRKEDLQVHKYPSFNLYCQDIVAFYEKLKELRVKVGPMNEWASEWNVHQDFDVYDPDGHAINLIEWHKK